MLKNPVVGAIVFYVADLARTERFYRDVLGLKTRVQPEASMLIAEAGKTLLLFFLGDEKPGRSPMVVFSLDEGGIDTLVGQLARKGVEIVLPVSEAPGGWTADFKDPDGHILSFYQDEAKPRVLTGN